MTGQFPEVPTLEERLGPLVDAIQNDRDERERLSREVAITERLREETIPKCTALVVPAHPSQATIATGSARLGSLRTRSDGKSPKSTCPVANV